MAFFALRCFAVTERNCEILLKLDNTTAIAYVNRMGGIQYPGLNVIARDIWQCCERRNIWIFATYIASRDNVEADMGSRIINIDTEWELAPWIFDVIVKEFGQPEIDLFASRANAKCKMFCSWHRDPESLSVDVFTISWKKYKFYAFPPFALILRVLRKIQSDQVYGIVVVPDWKAQPWFPLWQAMLVRPPLFFGPSDSILLSHCRTLQHPLATKLVLMVGILSGRRFEDKISQNDLLLSSIAESTMKQYQKPLQEWLEFCINRGYNSLSPEVS